MPSPLFLSALWSGQATLLKYQRYELCTTVRKGAVTVTILYTREATKPCAEALRAAEWQCARDNAPAESLLPSTLTERSSKRSKKVQPAKALSSIKIQKGVKGAERKMSTGT